MWLLHRLNPLVGLLLWVEEVQQKKGYKRLAAGKEL